MGNRSEQKADPAQETAIRKGAGPCAVIAGPGSGKTFVLVERIRCLIEERGVDPSSILVLTFSRAAAAHMRRRFLLSCPHPETVFGTFHSVFFRILQASSATGLRLIDPAAKQDYLRHLCSLPLPFLPEKTTAEELQLVISRYKNGLPCRQSWAPSLVEIYDAYLEGRGWLDFDDMILRCVRLLQEKPDLLAAWRERFRWILVDEFQDVSPAQYRALQLLAAPSDNLFVVGDDDQSIYGFRGTDPLIMQRFLSDYVTGAQAIVKEEPDRVKEEPDRVTGSRDGEDRIVFLTANYRCGRQVIRAASALIRANKNRIDKVFRPGTGLQGSFCCLPFTDRELEYSYIAAELKKMSEKERGQTAVIFRTHGGAAAFVRLLQERQVPFLAAAAGRRQPVLSDRTRILQDLCAYYRAAMGLCAVAGQNRGCFYPGKGNLREDLLRIMNRPERFLSGSFPGSGQPDKRTLLQNAGYERETAEELIRDLELLVSLSPVYSMRYLLDSVGYRACAFSDFEQAGPVLAEAEAESARFSAAGQWLRHLESLQERSRRRDAALSSGREESCAGARILTMHACKGLEFDTVFIPDVNEGNVPSRRAWTQDQVEEERRLLYVAMTRARRALTITYLEGTPDRPAAPSRFLGAFGQVLGQTVGQALGQTVGQALGQTGGQALGQTGGQAFGQPPAGRVN
jgi:DNA helicase-2/ATP-dependent DNA helicase PcrA